ncbi:winged helix-turn-helix domain-containing protein [Paenibacillus pini]|uniref:winged helix-turn-helix domain-containing protein n=1 Tax=Paenibacillus pini TaxID=669461 RepID=UPI00068AA5E2
MENLLINPIYLNKECYIDINRSVFICNSFPSALSRLELRLLLCLVHKIDEVVSFRKLYQYVWMVSEDEYIDLHLLYVYINRLRKKIENDPKKPELIISVRSVGYKLSSSST